MRGITHCYRTEAEVHRRGINPAYSYEPRFPNCSAKLSHEACHFQVLSIIVHQLAKSKMSYRTTGAVPPGYQTPPFPSLYWPIKPNAGFDRPKYLYYSQDVWRFTLFWTIIIFEASHIVASLYAVAVQWRNWKLMWIVPLVYMLVAGVEAVLAGSVVGLMCVQSSICSS